jgi:hypothetical protein
MTWENLMLEKAKHDMTKTVPKYLHPVHKAELQALVEHIGNYESLICELVDIEQITPDLRRYFVLHQHHAEVLRDFVERYENLARQLLEAEAKLERLQPVSNESILKP